MFGYFRTNTQSDVMRRHLEGLQRGWRVWVRLRRSVIYGYWLEKGATKLEVMDDVTRSWLTVYCGVRRNKEGTETGKLQAVNLYH